eukprot:NODE_3189_length_695_cov_83.791022_g2263_i0.p2 GENE.NODE_3189_length_695_cov_83.791022_g2263_i0~~NODE_3189_length_695_cov_83.791022_g2263_i0.p2  ORF type:complete len:178 (-),score=35.24 NODE_3189_length_695_cov_83.791022_g2263_i0:68-601(-)
MVMTGIVKKWVDEKGFGFIGPNDGSPDVFLHASEIDKASRERITITEGLEVEFDTRHEGGRIRAMHVTGRGGKPLSNDDMGSYGGGGGGGGGGSSSGRYDDRRGGDRDRDDDRYSSRDRDRDRDRDYDRGDRSRDRDRDRDRDRSRSRDRDRDRDRDYDRRDRDYGKDRRSDRYDPY